MKCSLLTLSCALDGELSRERQSELETHLVTCERCRTGMRYLREETDRISQLVKVAVPNATATALLERARVITIPGAEPAEMGTGRAEGSQESISDPFNLMGIGGAHIIEIGASAVAPATAVREPLPLIPSAALEPPDVPEETAQMAESPAEMAESPAEMVESPAEMAETQTATAPQDEVDEPTTLDSPAIFEQAEVDAGPSPSVSNEPDEEWEELDFAVTVDDQNSAIPSDRTIPIASTVPETAAASAELISSEAAQTPEATAEADDAEADWLAASQPPGLSAGTDGGLPQLFVPFYLPTGEMDPPRDDAEFEVFQVEAEEELESTPPELRDPMVDHPQAPGDSRGAVPVPDPIRESDEVMQVALEESALLGTLSALDRQPTGALPVMPAPSAPAATPPPPSVIAAGAGAAAGWVPNTSLNLDFPDIAAARPEMAFSSADSPSATAPPATEEKPAPALPQRSRFAPKRPADSVAPRTAGTTGGHPVPPRRRPSSNGRSGAAGSAARPAAPHSWTRTATVAIAALALFLIGWTVLHHSKATLPISTQHSTSSTHAKPTPTPPSQPTGSSGQTVTLTGIQSFGGTGSGYQVQSARFGLHQNNTQLWVVFQLVQGSGAPKVTTGFDGTTALYVEMAGVTGGQPVSQPATGGLITSVQPTKIAGFSGAAYVLNLSRSTQIVSEYLLTGSETSSSGERVVLELQN